MREKTKTDKQKQLALIKCAIDLAKAITAQRNATSPAEYLAGFHAEIAARQRYAAIKYVPLCSPESSGNTCIVREKGVITP